MELTICIPTHNRAEYLDQCLATLGPQITACSAGLVVLDNASDEDYSWVLQKHAHLDIEYIRNPVNIGAGANVQKAMEICRRSEFAMVMHDDDLVAHDFLDTELAALRADPDLAFVASTFCPFRDATPLPYLTWRERENRVLRFDDQSQLARVLLAGVPLHLGSVIYRSTALSRVRLDFDRYNMICDRPFLLEVARSRPCALMAQPLVQYRIHECQDSRSSILREHHVVALMQSYRSALPEPLRARDRRLFMKYSTNNMLDFYTRLSPVERPSLFGYARDARRRGLLNLRYLRIQGLDAIFRSAGAGYLSYVWHPGRFAYDLGLRRPKWMRATTSRMRGRVLHGMEKGYD